MTLDQAREDECSRLEENADHASQALFISSSWWGKTHMALVVAAAVLAFLAAALVSLPDMTGLALWPATAAGLCSTLSVAVGPSDRATTHRAAGEAYLGLRNRARQARAITLRDASASNATKARVVLDLETNRENIAQWAPDPGWFGFAFKAGARNIKAGRTTNTVDVADRD